MPLVRDWMGSAAKTESSIHQLSPYIGKTKSSMAGSLISEFTKKDDVICDPFSGSGTIALEAWLRQRHVIASDLSPYAGVLTRAKLFPRRTLEHALDDVERSVSGAAKIRDDIDLRAVPIWVRRFFHPETLREVIALVTVLRQRRNWFLLACVLGILHHQRPGFLSFPSSHTVPYLRTRRFPRTKYPELYEFRSLRERLDAKVTRAFRRVPELNFSITRKCFTRSDDSLCEGEDIDTIVTSPPYMRQLDYGRDNRLRLWFLGVNDWHALDRRISPREHQFLDLMRRCFTVWKTLLRPGCDCVLIIGDASSRTSRNNLPDTVASIATKEVGGYSRLYQYTDPIPSERRVRRGITGSASETILVLRRRSEPRSARTHP